MEHQKYTQCVVQKALDHIYRSVTIAKNEGYRIDFPSSLCAENWVTVMNISKSKQFTILRIQDLLNPTHICLQGPTIKLLCSTKTAIEPVRKADTGYIV